MKKWLLGASLSLDFVSASETLSFSAIKKNGSTELIQILKIEKEEVSYINLSQQLKIKETSPFQLLKGSNFEELSQKLKGLSKIEKTQYSELVSPLNFSKQHLCAGLNYKDHVEESGQKDQIVIFPKYGEVVGHNSGVPQSNNNKLPELLDYEVELGVVFDRDIKSMSDINSANAAFMVTNDFSDRAPQIYYFGKEGKPDSYSFTAAKSKKGYTLVAPIVVIPKNWQKFSKNLNMHLYLNGELKQKSSTSMMSQPIDEMLILALNQNSENSWPLLNTDETALDETTSLKLLPVDSESKAYIPEGMLFMTGTPGGTVFQKPGSMDLLFAALKAPFTKIALPTKTFKDKVKIALIQKLSKSGKYLKSGDRIESKIDSVGFLNFTISEKL